MATRLMPKWLAPPALVPLVGLLAMLAAPAWADTVRLARVDAAGTPTGEMIVGDLQDVNGADGELTVRLDGVVVPVAFTSVDFEDLHKALYRWLKQQPQPETADAKARLAAVHLALARLALIHFVPGDPDNPNLGRASDGMDNAVKLVPALAREIEPERMLWREARAMELLEEARIALGNAEFDAAERQLKRINSDYTDTAVAREAVAMGGEVSRQRSARAAAEAAADEAAVERPDPLQRVYPMVEAIDEQLREGHRLWSEARNSRVLNPWKRALAELEKARRVFDDTVKRTPADELDQTRVRRLDSRLEQIRLMLYKGLGHYYLGSTSFTECEALLNEALAFAPEDRELLQLRFVLNMHFLRRTVKPDDPDGPKPPELDLGGGDDDDG